MSQFSENGHAVKNGSEYFSEVKSRISVQDVLQSEGITLGRNNRCICPFHDGDNGGNPNGFSLNPDGEHMTCFVCQWHGDIIDFYGKTHGIPSQIDAARELDERFGRAPIVRKPKPDRFHDYQDEYGNVVFRTIRKLGRWFQERYDRETHRFVGGKGCMQGVVLYPYRLPELLLRLEESPDEIVYIAEGEKDVDTLWKLGRAATCNPMGAGKWRDDFSKWFAGRKVVVFQDDDQVGRQHAQKVAGSLHGVGCVVRVLGMPGGHHDVSDYVAAGGTWKELVVAIREAKDWAHTVQEIDDVETITLEDIKALMGQSNRFLCKGMMVRHHLNVIGAKEKTGKTHVGLDLCRRIYFGIAWPNGEPPSFPEGTPTIWVCGDRHQEEVLERGEAMGIPLSAIILNSPGKGDEYGGLCLDDPENRLHLDKLCAKHHPALIIIDTLGGCTTKKMHIMDEAKQFFDPLIDIALKNKTTLLALTHLNKEGDFLSLRIKGIARSLWKLTAPGTAQPDRRRLEVTGNFKEPPALGVTLYDGGAEYDWDPPAPDASEGGGLRGRPRGTREDTKAWIMDRLEKQNHLRATHLQEEAAEAGVAVKATFWRAIEELEEAHLVIRDGKPFYLHLANLPLVSEIEVVRQAFETTP